MTESQSQLSSITNVTQSRIGCECKEFRRLMHWFYWFFFSCLQCIRNVQGVLLFLLSVKFLSILGFHRTVANLIALLAATLSNLFWSTVSALCSNTALILWRNTLPQILKRTRFCQSRRKKKYSSFPLPDFRTHLDGGAVQHGKPSVWAKLEEL